MAETEAIVDGPMLHISDDERRARMARRHGIARAYRRADVEAGTRAMTALHATEHATVYLSLHARVEGLTRADVDRAFYDERGLVKQLAMRRTLFAFPRDLLPAVLGSAAARVAGQQARQIAKDVVQGGLTDAGAAWVAAARRAVLARLAGGEALGAARLREEVPEIQGRITVGGPHTAWGGEVSIGPRVLTLLGAEGHIVRGANDGAWNVARPQWTLMASWLGERPAATKAEEGYATLVRRWLAAFGPGTEADLVWWLGATKTAVRRALLDVAAVEVGLDGGGTGWVLPDDVDPVGPVEPWAALLPVLDPTTMGWRRRDFYLDPAFVPHLFDSNGNAGTTAWWCGRIVGCWVQDGDGVVRVILLDDPGAEARTVLDAEAERLTTWLGGARVAPVYKSSLMQGDLPR